MKLSYYFALPMFMLFFNPLAAIADAGDRQIELQGHIKTGIEERLSVKNLEKKFTLFSTQIYNPWDKKTARYKGIWLHELAQKLAKKETQAIITSAIDDYQITFPRELWQKERILLVTQENNAYIPISKKGPMRIIFPDYDPSKAIYSGNLPMWMWMIKTIEFK